MELENNILNVRPTDEVYVTVMRELIERLDNVGKAVAYLLPQVRLIGTDSYFLHYSVFPVIRKEPNPDKYMEMARKTMKSYSDTDRFKSLKVITELDHDLSLVYSTSLTRSIVEKIVKNLMRRNPHVLTELERLGKQLSPNDVLQSQCQMCGAGGKQGRQRSGQQKQQGGGGQGKQSSRQRQQGQGGQGGSRQAGRVNSEVLKALSSAAAEVMSSDMKDVMNSAAKAAEMFRDIREMLGGKWAGKTPGAFEEALDLADELMRVEGADLILTMSKKIDECMPKFEKLVKRLSKKGEELEGYGVTRRVEDALPRELALPDELFYYKLASSGLLRKLRRSVHEGCYYVLIDKSGSMAGEKTVWARSVALAIYRKAMRKGREFFLRFFDYNVYELVSNPKVVLRTIVTVKSNGGTNITWALRKALRDIASNPRVRGKTNTVIIITDGEDTVSVSPQEFKKVNAVLTAVMVQGHNRTLQELAEKTGGQYFSVEPTLNGALRIVSMI